MASTVDLCWTTAEDLMREVDLDSLYERQVRAIGATRNENYPYLLLVYTGKITIGINLGNEFGNVPGFGAGASQGSRLRDKASVPESSFNDPRE